MGMLEKKRNPPGAGLARKSRHAVPSRSRSLRQAAREHGKGGGQGLGHPKEDRGWGGVGWGGLVVRSTAPPGPVAARTGARRIPGPPPPGPAASRTGSPGSAVARAGSPGPAASRTRRRPDRSSRIPGPGHPIPPSPRAGPPGPAGLRDRGAGVRPPPGRGPCVPGRLPDTDRRMVRGTGPAACTGPRPPGCPCLCPVPGRPVTGSGLVRPPGGRGSPPPAVHGRPFPRLPDAAGPYAGRCPPAGRRGLPRPPAGRWGPLPPACRALRGSSPPAGRRAGGAVCHSPGGLSRSGRVLWGPVRGASRGESGGPGVHRCRGCAVPQTAPSPPPSSFFSSSGVGACPPAAVFRGGGRTRPGGGGAGRVVVSWWRRAVR